MLESLAERIRPKKIEEMVGQKHLLEKNKVLRKIIDSCFATNLVFYGPPGTGKTTLAKIISKNFKKPLRILNCTTTSILDIKKIISENETILMSNGIILYLDEIQYFNKKQQQILLEFIEKGSINLITSTTENPYFCIHSALLSRVMVFEFKPIDKDEIIKLLKRAISSFLKKIIIDEKSLEKIAYSCGHDARKALNILELAIVAGNNKITSEIINQLTIKSAIKYDKSGDEHFDLLSAFQKSMRGSDPDAAIHYLARLLESGDLLSVCRRIMVCACEDVGLAYPLAINFVKSCVDIALAVGLPEARIPLADATILICISSKSNSAYNAINNAISDIKSGISGPIPRHLQNKHFDGEDNKNKGRFYKYPHNFKNNYVKQQYLPNEIKNKKYYFFGENKNEQNFKNYFNSLKNSDSIKII